MSATFETPPSINLPIFSFEKALEATRAQGEQTLLASGQNALTHSLTTAEIVRGLQVDEETVFAALLIHVQDLNLNTTLQKHFPSAAVTIALAYQKLARIGVIAHNSQLKQAQQTHKINERDQQQQIEAVRKLLLAFADDLRVILLRLAAQLAHLRFACEATLNTPLQAEHALNLARETLSLYAPLANRLGIWQIKWELEDSAFKLTQAQAYQHLSHLLEASRTERSAWLHAAAHQLQHALKATHIKADISSRPKHLYSIFLKMRKKNLAFEQLYDVHALRVIVSDVKACYATLAVVQSLWHGVQTEYDDYIARPKANGYQSLHCVASAADGRIFEVQIRTQEMHEFAEYGVAAHWKYKEASTHDTSFENKINALRNLLAWRDEVAEQAHPVLENLKIDVHAEKPRARAEIGHGEQNERFMGVLNETLDESVRTYTRAHIKPHPTSTTLGAQTIFVLTPEARVLELPHNATPIDFAYQLHTELGHRCRGARIDGHLCALNTPLRNGQTVEIIAAKSGGPSRDWLNTELGFVHSSRARAKVRAWFNAQELSEALTQGRALLEKILARLGKSAVNLDELASKLSLRSADELCWALAKDELGIRQIETALQGGSEKLSADQILLDRLEQHEKARHEKTLTHTHTSGVLVVGVDALLTQLARCCKPAPPDAIAGYITRGKGVSIHRQDCSNMRALVLRNNERIIECAWGAQTAQQNRHYAVDVLVEAQDRTGLLRDISELLAREKINVTAVNTVSQKGLARMQFTLEVSAVAQLQRALSLIGEIKGIQGARRG